MIGLFVLACSVCLLAGLFIGLMAPQWLHGDDWDRLAERDRRRGLA